MTAPIDNPDAPSTDAYEEYDRSLDRLVMLGQPVNDQVRAAYAAGYKDGRAAERYLPGVQGYQPDRHFVPGADINLMD